MTKTTPIRKKKSVVKSKPKNRLDLQLDGNIYIIEYKNGKQITKDEIDGTLVLNLIIKAIEGFVDSNA